MYPLTYLANEYLTQRSSVSPLGHLPSAGALLLPHGAPTHISL